MSAFLDYYRCPAGQAEIGTQLQLSPREGYFKFGDAVAFGRFAGGRPAAYSTDPLTSGAFELPEQRVPSPSHLPAVMAAGFGRTPITRL